MRKEFEEVKFDRFQICLDSRLSFPIFAVGEWGEETVGQKK